MNPRHNSEGPTNASQLVRILVVDDHEVVRNGLQSSLASIPGHVVEAAPDARSALEQSERTPPDVIVLDLRLPDMSGIELCRRLRAAHPSTGIVFLTAYLSEETVREALYAGASEYVTKAAGLAELRAAIDRARRPRERPGPGEAQQVVKRLHALVSSEVGETLPTPCQARVLELAADGLTNREIGSRLFLSESTVRFHIQRLKARMGARTKTELIAKAIRAGVISPAPEHTSGRS